MISWLLIGCYTLKPNSGKGIYTCQLNQKTGELTPIVIFEELPNPSFLAVQKDKRMVYAVMETSDFAGENSGGVATLQFDDHSGKLTCVNTQATGGADPCHIRAHDRLLLVTNYDGASVAVLPLNANGILQPRCQFFTYHGHSVHPTRQNCSHPHSTIFSPDYRYVYVADLGLDCLHAYRFDTNQNLLTATAWGAVKTPPGSGPRHLVFHPNGQHAYLINELNNTLIVYRYEPESGQLHPEQVISTLPDDFTGENTAAEIQILKQGRFLYASNRGHNSLAIFEIDQTGHLRRQGFQSTLGQGPRHFMITPEEHMLLCANQNSGNVVSFFINTENGQLTPTGKSSEFGQPVCLLAI